MDLFKSCFHAIGFKCNQVSLKSSSNHIKALVILQLSCNVTEMETTETLHEDA